ncbi:MAG: DoxX-like family protein [Mucilaginibacter sp.]|nr:DoxX-like family protein [Mucilaginibacter sp.]
MKKINTFYWVFTVLLVLLMLSSAIPSLMNSPQSVAFMKHLGYPIYFAKFLAVAKLLGIVALLVPGFPKITEWAYAGFTFDLIAAFYSFIALGDPASTYVLFPVFFAILTGSYIFYHKRLKAAVLHETVV